MINEPNILLWFGLTLIMIVLVMLVLLKVLRRNAYYSAFMSSNSAENIHPIISKNTRPVKITTAIATLPDKEQSNLYQRIFESAPECVILQKRDGIIELINNTGLKLLETKESSKVIGSSVFDLIPEEYHQVYREMVNKVFLGNHESLEYEMVTFQGNRRWMQTNVAPLRDSHHEIVNLIAITRDITDNNLLSLQHKAHRDKLQTIIESEPECVKLQDNKGEILEMNPAGLSLLEAKKCDDVIGKIVYDFITPEYVKEYRELTKKVFNGNRASMEFQVIGLKGRRRWLETHAAPLFDNFGNVSELLAITRDIDERKKNEARLFQQQAELARVCRLSTMGEMASSLAHELNQPLCAVSSYAESARYLNSLKDKELDALLEKIVYQSQRATQIIKNIRDFVRKQSPEPEAISAASVVKNILDFVAQNLRNGMIEVSMHIADSLPLMIVDRVQIEQVLLNLISNAIEAMQELDTEKRIITIQVKPYSNEEVIFKICNTGPCISADVEKELFTSFYTTKPTGMGMGLSISRSIIEAHGGSIWYMSEHGHESSCFCFTLPILKNV